MVLTPSAPSLFWNTQTTDIQNLTHITHAFTREQLQQPQTYANWQQGDWRFHQGVYPYPYALDLIFQPEQPLTYNTSLPTHFAYPLLANQHYHALPGKPWMAHNQWWARERVESLGDFIVPLVSDNTTSILESRYPLPPSRRVFPQWSPEGLWIINQQPVADKHYRVLWQARNSGNYQLSDYFLVSGEDAGKKTHRFQSGSLSLPLPGRAVGLALWSNHSLVAGEQALWQVNDHGVLYNTLSLPVGISIDKLLAHRGDHLYLLGQGESTLHILPYHYLSDNGWQADNTIALPVSIKAIDSAVQNSEHLFMASQDTSGFYQLYQLDSAGTLSELTNLSAWLGESVEPGSIRLTWHDNALHLAARTGGSLHWLQLSCSGAVIRTALFIPDTLATVTDQGFLYQEETLYYYAAGEDVRGMVRWQLWPWLPSPAQHQLTGETWEPVYSHNFTEVYRNPRGRFRLVEDITGLNDASLRPPLFTGGLDGQYHAIHGLNYTGTPPLTQGGLFARMANATLGNLTLYNLNISGYPWSGALAGESDYSLFENIRLMGGQVLGRVVAAGKSYAAALVGHSDHDRFRAIEIALRVEGEEGLKGEDGTPGEPGRIIEDVTTILPPIEFTESSSNQMVTGQKGLAGETRGNNGTNGTHGLPGHNGAHAALVTGQSTGSRYDLLVLHNNATTIAGGGGQGGQGGDGGHGGRGQRGGPGQSIYFYTDYFPVMPGAGGDGGPGGNGGDGGHGGRSGQPGRTGFIIDSREDVLSQWLLNGQYMSGQPQPGLGGKPGEQGMVGAKGADGVIYFFPESLRPVNFTQPAPNSTIQEGEQGLPGLPGKNGTIPTVSLPPANLTLAPGSIVYNTTYIKEGLNQSALASTLTYADFDPGQWRIREGYQPYPVALDPVYRADHNATGAEAFAYPGCTFPASAINQRLSLFYKRLWSSYPCIDHYPIVPSQTLALAINDNGELLAVESKPDDNTAWQLRRYQVQTDEGFSTLAETGLPVPLPEPAGVMVSDNNHWLLVGERSVLSLAPDNQLETLSTPLSTGSLTRMTLLSHEADRLYLSTYQADAGHYRIVRYQKNVSTSDWQAELLEPSLPSQPLAGTRYGSTFCLVTRDAGQWLLTCLAESSGVVELSATINDWLPGETIQTLQLTHNPDAPEWLHALVTTDSQQYWFRLDAEDEVIQKATLGEYSGSVFTGFNQVDGTLQAYQINGYTPESLTIWEEPGHWLDMGWQRSSAMPGSTSLKVAIAGGLTTAVTLTAITVVGTVVTLVYCYKKHHKHAVGKEAP